MSVPNAADKRRLKRRLVERDGLACFYCRTPFAAAGDATLDHLVPQSIMPGWKQANLVLACAPCNAAKADTLPQSLLRPSGYGPGLVPLADIAAHKRGTASLKADMDALRADISALFEGDAMRTLAGRAAGRIRRTLAAPVAGSLAAAMAALAAGSLAARMAGHPMTEASS